MSKERTNRMKKKVNGFLIAILLMFALSACGTSKPSNVVEDAMKHMQNNEISEAGQYFYTDSEKGTENENQDESESYSNVVLQAMTACAEENAGYIKYEIADSTIDGEEATVTVNITYKNAGPILKLAINDLTNQSISNAFSSAFLGGGELNDDDMSAIFLASFEKAKENAAIIDKTDTLEIHCKKVNKEWKITNYEELLNVYYCNMYVSLDSISSSSDEDVSIEENTDPPLKTEPDSSDITYFKDNGMKETTMSFADWDEFNEMTLDLKYIGEDSNGQYVGEAEMRISTYDEETGETETITGSGTFTEDAEGNGRIVLDNGNSGDYYLYWEEDHYVLSIDIGRDAMTLLEAEWAYNNVG